MLASLLTLMFLANYQIVMGEAVMSERLEPRSERQRDHEMCRGRPLHSMQAFPVLAAKAQHRVHKVRESPSYPNQTNLQRKSPLETRT